MDGKELRFAFVIDAVTPCVYRGLSVLDVSRTTFSYKNLLSRKGEIDYASYLASGFNHI